jgi:hypothetical protein
MKTNQNDFTLNLGYFLSVLAVLVAFYLIIAVNLGDFANYSSSIGDSHLMKPNH